MREIKLKPILVSFIIVLVLLASGSFTYQYFAQQKPLEQALDSMSYSQMTFPINKHEGLYQLKIEVVRDHKLIDAMSEIADIMQRYDIDEHSYAVSIVNQTDQGLQSIWQSKLFEVAEIMANENYSKLPILLNAIEEEHEGITATADIDEQQVYFTLIQNEQRFDIILPLEGGKMGVWSNER